MELCELFKNNKLTNKEKLDILQSKYSKNTVFTNGLFHIIDDEHNEIYINGINGSIDNRAKYRTLAVTDKVIITKLVNNSQFLYVILVKNSLDCIYKTKNTIYYLNNNIFYEMLDNKIRIISHTGKVLGDIEGKEIAEIKEDVILIKNNKAFKDNIWIYSKQNDTIRNSTENKNYLIYKSEEDDTAVEIMCMNGGKYRYNFTTHQCVNKFTGKIEEIQLWDLI